MSNKSMTTNQLREELSGLYFDLKKGDIELDVAQELNDICGKILGTMKIDLMQQSLEWTMSKPAKKIEIGWAKKEPKALPKKT
jgi:hypothetical protein